MNPADPIVITGLGTLGAAGFGARALAEWLSAGDVRYPPVDRSGGFHREGSAISAAAVGRLSTTDWIPPLVARRMSPPSRHAVATARMAARDSGLEPSKEPDPSVGVVIATAFPATSYTQRLLDQVRDEGPEMLSPAVFTECVANAPAGQVAIQCRAAGPNYTLSNREAGPLLALARAADEVRLGRATSVLAGCVDEVTPLVHAILDRFGALTRDRGDGFERALPFDRRRDGFVAAEGATMLVLERASAAKRRDARPLARVVGHMSAFDATATPAGWGTGADTLAQALRSGLRRHGLEPEDVDLIVSGASGSRTGDRLEALTLRAAWADRALPPIVAPKSVTGEYGGGFLAAAVLATSGRAFRSPAGFEMDPDLGILPASVPASDGVRRVLVSTLAAGGAAAWVVMEKP